MTGARQSTEAPASGVDVREHPVPLPEFQKDYLLARRPLVIRTGGLAAIDWRTDRWNSNYLVEKVGPRKVVVQVRRGGIFGAGQNPESFRPMRFDEFVRRVMDGDKEAEDLYLNLQNMDRLMTSPLLQLLGDFTLPIYFRDLPVQWINLWMGRTTRTTKSQMHHDFHDNLYCVVEGEKQFTIFPPEDADRLYTQGRIASVEPNGVIRYEAGTGAGHPHFSRIDTELVDTARFPRYAEATPRRVTIGAGDLFFMPAGWFHEVRSSGRHIAINFWADPPPTGMVARTSEPDAPGRRRVRGPAGSGSSG